MARLSSSCLFLRLCSLLLAASLSNSQESCLGPGFTQTIPPQVELSQYSATVLAPGDRVIYTVLSFRCNGKLESLTIPSQVRSSDYPVVDNGLEPRPSIWRLSGNRYNMFFDSAAMQNTRGVPGTTGDADNIRLNPGVVLSFNFTVLIQMDIQAGDVLGFHLRNRASDGRIEHLPLLYKPGPTPGNFTPIIIANFMPTSEPIIDEANSALPCANETDLDNRCSVLPSSIIAAVSQVEVIVVAIVTGLIVHFVTRRAVRQKSVLSQDVRSGNTTELGTVRTDNKPLYETVGLGASTGEDVELQPSPAYQAVPEYL